MLCISMRMDKIASYGNLTKLETACTSFSRKNFSRMLVCRPFQATSMFFFLESIWFTEQSGIGHRQQYSNKGCHCCEFESTLAILRLKHLATGNRRSTDL